MGTDARWLIIVNPASGRPDGGAGWRAIEGALRDAGVTFDVIHTEQPGHGAEIASAALLQGRRHLAVAGGDGSVNEVVHGIMNAGLADTREVTLAVIPTGTGNDWARTLGITRRPWFINVAGAGYDAYVTERVPRPVPSAFTYLRIALEGLAQYRAPRFCITADGETIEGPLLLAFVANAQYCGNRMHVVPTARTDDGQLDVLAVRELSLLAVWPKLVKLYSGRILGDRAVRHLRAGRVRIEAEPPAVIQADGQIVGRTPAEFSLLTLALRVIVP